jgi:hypothetical protein
MGRCVRQTKAVSPQPNVPWLRFIQDDSTRWARCIHQTRRESLVTHRDPGGQALWDVKVSAFVNICRPPSVIYWLACLPLLRVLARSTTVDFYRDKKSVARKVKPSVPCRRFTACKRALQSMSEMLCRQTFLDHVSHPWFFCFATRWLWLLNQDNYNHVEAAAQSPAPHKH